MRGLVPFLCALSAVCALTGLSAPAAMSAAPSQAVADCNSHGRLTHAYTPAQLRAALSTMPADIKEYTDCYDVIQRRLLAQLGSTQGSAAAPASSSGGSSVPTAAIVIIAVIVVAAAGFGAVAMRRRR